MIQHQITSDHMRQSLAHTNKNTQIITLYYICSVNSKFKSVTQSELIRKTCKNHMPSSNSQEYTNNSISWQHNKIMQSNEHKMQQTMTQSELKGQ